MARGIALSTAGVKIGYAVEATAGTRPTDNYTRIHDIKEVPDFNPEPETIETTDLEQEEYKTYVDGLKDLGGALSFTANFTAALQTAWAECVDAYDEAEAAGKKMYFVIHHPRLTNAVYFHGKPSALGLPGMGVNSVLETRLYITPMGAPEWGTPPTSIA